MGKQSATHPTSVHLIKHCKKKHTHEQVYNLGEKPKFEDKQEFSAPLSR
jgi:hypothetical protein